MFIIVVVTPQLLALLSPSDRGLGRVSGVTQVDDVIYIIHYESSALEMFDGTFQRLKDNIKLNEMKYPTDIIGDSVNKQLLVAQYHSGDILRVNLQLTDVSLFIDHKHGIRGMSMTRGRLLVTSLDTLSLFVYSVNDGSQLLAVQLPRIVKFTLHSVESKRETFNVCYMSVKDTIELIELNSRGEIIHEFRNDRQLYRPWHMALDSSDRVVFTDWRVDGDDRIVLLNNDLQFSKFLLDKKQLSAPPSRLHYDIKNKQLFVGLLNGRVYIYKWQ